MIYIIKENRTYDQVFGDIPEGNGDPRLCLFPEKVTPNAHALAREFVEQALDVRTRHQGGAGTVAVVGVGLVGQPASACRDTDLAVGPGRIDRGDDLRAAIDVRRRAAVVSG